MCVCVYVCMNVRVCVHALEHSNTGAPQCFFVTRPIRSMLMYASTNQLGNWIRAWYRDNNWPRSFRIIIMSVVLLRVNVHINYTAEVSNHFVSEMRTDCTHRVKSITKLRWQPNEKRALLKPK